jgi:hypothetical protein
VSDRESGIFRLQDSHLLWCAVPKPFN